MPVLKGKITLNSKEARNAIRGLDRSVNKFKKNVGVPLFKVGKMAAVAGAAMAAMSVAAIKSVATAGDAMDKMAKRTGIATDELSRYAHAAALSGGSIDGMEKSLKAMGTALYEAERGTKTYTDALDGLGLSFEDLKDLDPSARFDLILSKLAGVEDASMRSALALKVFGRNGIQLLPMLSEGAAGLKAMKAEADRLGIVFSTDQAASAARLVDEVTRLKSGFRGLFIQGTDLEGVSDAIAGLTDSIIVLRESGAFNQITVAMVQFAEKGVRAINHIVAGLNSLTDAERDALKNATIVFAGVTIAFKAGLLMPMARGLTMLVANFMTASAAVSTILSGLAGLIAGYNFGEAIESKFNFSGKWAEHDIKKKLKKAEAEFKAIQNAPDQNTREEYDQWSAQYKSALWDVKQAREELKAIQNMNGTSALMSGQSLSENFVNNMKQKLEKVTPDSFKDLLSAGSKLFGEIPDLPELTKSAAFAGSMEEASAYAENIAKIMAPIRGFMTGGLSINHAMSGQATSTEKREGEKTQTAKDQLREQQKSNELLTEMVGEIQSRGSFSFAF